MVLPMVPLMVPLYLDEEMVQWMVTHSVCLMAKELLSMLMVPMTVLMMVLPMVPLMVPLYLDEETVHWMATQLVCLMAK